MNIHVSRYLLYIYVSNMDACFKIFLIITSLAEPPCIAQRANDAEKTLPHVWLEQSGALSIQLNCITYKNLVLNMKTSLICTTYKITGSGFIR